MIGKRQSDESLESLDYFLIFQRILRPQRYTATAVVSEYITHLRFEALHDL